MNDDGHREMIATKRAHGGVCVRCMGSTRRHVELLPSVFVLLCFHCEERISSREMSAILTRGFAA